MEPHRKRILYVRTTDDLVNAVELYASHQSLSLSKAAQALLWAGLARVATTVAAPAPASSIEQGRGLCVHCGGQRWRKALRGVWQECVDCGHRRMP